MSEETQVYRDEVRLDLPSASGMEIVVACPGSVRLKNSLPPEAFKQKPAEENEWAEAGTRIHKARETGNTLELDAEESEIYRQGIEYEKEIVTKWARDKALDSYEEGPREMRVWLLNPLNWPERLASVQLDVHYFNRERGCVLSLDWKSGWNPNLPPSPRSWQLRFGAVALWKEVYGDWMKECRVAHCKAQQKCTVGDYCDYQERDLIYSWESIRFHVWESTQPNAPLHPGPHCNWCPCKAYCVQAGAYTMMPSVIAKRVPDAALMPWEMMIEKMVPADLLKIWENSTIIDKIIKAVKARLKAMPAEQLALLGLELGKGRKNDSVGNVALAFRLLCQHFDESKVLGCFDLAKGKLVDLVRSERGMSKEDAEQWVDAQLDPFMDRKTSEAPLRRMKGSGPLLV